jgi:endonuclease YncB( thermonuclease family)
MRYLALTLAVVMFAGAAQAQAPAPQATRPPATAPAASLDDTPDMAPASVAPVLNRLPERVIRPMRAVDPMTLRAEGGTIRLWGIKPAQSAETPLELKALDLMDGLIQEQVVNCRVMGGSMLEMTARCSTSSNQDLALELLKNGFVVVDRRQTYNTVFATAYEKEQETARVAGRGVWALVKEDMNQTGSSGLPRWLEPYMSVLLPLALIFGPFGGLLIVGFVMWYWLRRMASLQEKEAEQTSRKEAMLQSRERHVLVSTLEGELMENKNKIEAFLVIYGDMLRSLQDANEVPKYQQGGDIVQKHPTFGRAVFEANVSKLSLLDIKLAGQISKLYSAMPKDQEYINLEPTVPLETAVKLVQKVLKEAEALLDPLNSVITGLSTATQKKADTAA